MKHCIYVILLLISGTSYAQLDELLPKIEFKNKVYSEDIHTPLVHKGDDQLSAPIIELNSSDFISIRFDDFSLDMKNYKFTFVHCTYDWKPSDIPVFEYLEGFETGDILEYDFSFNTFQSYTHHIVLFPNEQIQLQLSGNYLLIVYDEQEELEPLFTHRISLYETGLVKLYTDLKPATLPKLRDSHHELDIQVDYEDFQTFNALEEFHLVLQQNGRWDNMITELKPNRFRSSFLQYDYELENSFGGGNEFREFSIKSLQTYGIGVKRIARKDSVFRVKLRHDGERDKAYYNFSFDINGKRQIHVVNRNNPHREGDYATVNFTLVSPFGEMNGDVYVVGALNNWALDESNRMKYMPRTNSYRKYMRLKQGYYNYQYVFVPEGETTGLAEVFEGDYFQTNNEYQVFLYHSNQDLTYDRLVGVRFLEINAF
jgi:hypothetical protein